MLTVVYKCFNNKSVTLKIQICTLEKKRRIDEIIMSPTRLVLWHCEGHLPNWLNAIIWRILSDSWTVSQPTATSSVILARLLVAIFGPKWRQARCREDRRNIKNDEQVGMMTRISESTTKLSAEEEKPMTRYTVARFILMGFRQRNYSIENDMFTISIVNEPVSLFEVD